MRTCSEILEAAVDGYRIGPDEAGRLFGQADLADLGRAADRIRERLHNDGVISYIIDRNINYTNVCKEFCSFCAFYRTKGHPEAYVLPAETIYDKIREAVDLGGTGILMQGGVHPDLRIDYYETLLAGMRERFPDVQRHCFSPSEILNIARVSGLTVAETFRRLKSAGLQSMPGGGGEILDDEVREDISPLKCSTEDWLMVHRIAHQEGLRTTATMMVGVGERLEHRIRHLDRIRRLQDETGGFTAFIPWTFQDENTPLGERGLPPVRAAEYLRLLALARVFLDNVANLQVSWLTVGLKLGSVALRFGVNDMGSIMIEENVISAAGARNRASAETLRRVITDAGFIPRQRTTLYERFVN
jgi:cyclic dehypoxanthinyl futalosine synthase